MHVPRILYLYKAILLFPILYLNVPKVLSSKMGFYSTIPKVEHEAYDVLS